MTKKIKPDRDGSKKKIPANRIIRRLFNTFCCLFGISPSFLRPNFTRKPLKQSKEGEADSRFVGKEITAWNTRFTESSKFVVVDAVSVWVHSRSHMMNRLEIKSCAFCSLRNPSVRPLEPNAPSSRNSSSFFSSLNDFVVPVVDSFSYFAFMHFFILDFLERKLLS